MTYKLLPYQEKTVDFGLKNPYCIYALQMGLGKSLCALATADKLKAKTLIICPVYLMFNWRSEVNKFFPNKSVSVFKHKKEFYVPVDTDIIIISYSFVGDADKLFEWADLVVCDESQYLKETKTKRTEAVHRLVYENSVSRLILLTGTPILNRVYELYSLFALMEYNPRIEESSFLKRFPTYVDFACYFSHLNEREIYRGNRRVRIQEFSGVKNLEELKKLKDKYMVVYKSSDVLELPESEDVYFHVDDMDMPELQEAFDEFLSDKSNHAVAPNIKAKAALMKAPLTAEYVKELMSEGQQVVVYSDHVEAATCIAEALGVKVITGQTPPEVRSRLANAFQANESEVIVATIGSFSTGVNLQNAHNMVFNDYNWVPGQMEQAKFRIVRVGQKKRCKFHYMIGSKQDEYILGKLEAKISTINSII